MPTSPTGAVADGGSVAVADGIVVVTGAGRIGSPPPATTRPRATRPMATATRTIAEMMRRREAIRGSATGEWGVGAAIKAFSNSEAVRSPD